MTSHRSTWIRFWLVAAATIAILIGSGAPAGAQDDPPSPTTTIPEAPFSIPSLPGADRNDGGPATSPSATDRDGLLDNDITIDIGDGGAEGPSQSVLLIVGLCSRRSEQLQAPQRISDLMGNLGQHEAQLVVSLQDAGSHAFHGAVDRGDADQLHSHRGRALAHP